MSLGQTTYTLPINSFPFIFPLWHKDLYVKNENPIAASDLLQPLHINDARNPSDAGNDAVEMLHVLDVYRDVD